MARISSKIWLFALIVASITIYMLITTSARIEFEGLTDEVFRFYFDVSDFGALEPLITHGGAGGFLASTVVVYAASTFNNAVIRLQELQAIIPSFGYKFVFFYVYALRFLFPSFIADFVIDWRDLATYNNSYLLQVSPAATQWATPYGDLVWDFGILCTFLLVSTWYAGLGWIMTRARLLPSFERLILAVVIVGFSLSPLVNPLLSLYVHYMLGIVMFMWLARRLHARRIPKGRRNAAVLKPVPAAVTPSPT